MYSWKSMAGNSNSGGLKIGLLLMTTSKIQSFKAL